MLNRNERKVLRYLQRKNECYNLQSFKFIDKMYDELDPSLNVTQILLSLEKLGYIQLNKKAVNFDYVTTFKSGTTNMSIVGITVKEEGLIYDLNHKKILLKHMWLSFLLPIIASITATLCTWLITR